METTFTFAEYTVEFPTLFRNINSFVTINRGYFLNDNGNKEECIFKIYKSKSSFDREYNIHQELMKNSLYEKYCIQLLDYFVCGEKYVLVFEKGEFDLFEYLKCPLERKKCVDLSLKIIEAIEFIHSLGIIHIDIKPENIMIKDKQVKLIDFGCSFIQTFPDQNCESTTHVGTREFMDPISLKEKETSLVVKYNKTTDLYALSVTLFELISGQRYKAPRNPVNGTNTMISNRSFDKNVLDIFDSCLTYTRVNNETNKSVRLTIEELKEKIKGLV